MSVSLTNTKFGTKIKNILSTEMFFNTFKTTKRRMKEKKKNKEEEVD
jgi:hypothetical protein